MATTREITRNLGGNRLGSGNKNNIDLHAYNRSTHDLTRVWRSSMNVGTLVPFLVELGVNGDSFSINLDNITRTLPSLGPLYGSYKLQLDVFEAPLRLYNGLLHNNMNGIGLNMAAVKFPKIELSARVRNRNVYNEDLNKSQISKSSLINYLGLNGIADYAFTPHTLGGDTKIVKRKFNAVPLLAYWDIYKNYYANKQEEVGTYILPILNNVINGAEKITSGNDVNGYETHKLTNVGSDLLPTIPAGKRWLIPYDENNPENPEIPLAFVTKITLSNWQEATNKQNIRLMAIRSDTQVTEPLVPPLIETLDNGDVEIKLYHLPDAGMYTLKAIQIDEQVIRKYEGTTVDTFSLDAIDEMRMEILRNTGLNNEFMVNNLANLGGLWGNMCSTSQDGISIFKYPQAGLGLKTYQSDLFNNWLKTEWIDGANGINKITAIDTSSGSFEIDALILSKKIYNMLNRIAVSGGSYEDWQEAVYSVKAIRRAETPVYRGGMSAEIMFSEVVSNSATTDEPLGTLAGKGGEHAKKGGEIEISCDEPCIIMGIVSITPRIDYSQGNSWILTELDTMDDIHKPALDGIGFEDLLQERMAFWGTAVNDNDELVRLAAGKVPAWMNYMTAVNETHGDFAEEDKCMYMTLNRRYEFYKNTQILQARLGISDLTTYVDPRKYNYIFADSSIDSQNFWIQIGIGINARRVMSAKVIPYL